MNDMREMSAATAPASPIKLVMSPSASMPTTRCGRSSSTLGSYISAPMPSKKSG